MTARRELEHTRTALSSVEQQRAVAEDAASQAAHKRGEAEAAAAEATRRRSEAELAAAEAAKQRTGAEAAAVEATRRRSEAELAAAEAAKQRTGAEQQRAGAEQQRAAAEQQRKEAEAAARTAKAAADAAEGQRLIAETAARAAVGAKHDAEVGLAELSARRIAAERAATELEARSKAFATAQAEVAAAKTRKASDDELTQARAEARRLADDRQHAAIELADRRKAVDAQKAEADRLRLAASQAHDAADREEARRASLAAQRAAEEQALARIQVQKSQTLLAADQAAQRRGEAEQAASEAAQRRGEAEQQRAAAEQQRATAEQQRATAEQQRKEAEAAARTAKAAAEAADSQRRVAEAAAKAALGAKQDAEAGLAELSVRRGAAERAATELEARSKAFATAQAEVVAAKARKASEDELAQARAEARRLADDRQHAASELADRRKAVDAQKAEADRLRLAASQAHDAADREEARRARLAAQRVAEEQALAQLAARKTAALLAAAPADAAGATRAGMAMQPTGAAGKSVVPGATRTGMAMQPTGAAGTSVAAGATSAGRAAPSAGATAMQPDRAGVPSGGPAGKPGKPTPLAQVRDIAFTGDDVTGHVHITLAGDATVTVGEVTPTTAELIVDHAQLAPKLERKLDVSRFGGPVRAVSSFRDRRVPDRVRVIAELSSPATPSFDRETGSVRWSFVGADIAKRPVTTRPGIARTQNVPSPVVSGFGAASTPVAQQSVAQLPPQGSRRRVYHGQTVELHFKDAPIHDLLRIIADTGKVSIVVPDTIDAKVTLDLKRVPWDQALEVILSSHQLWYRREGNLYRIAPRKELDAEDEAEGARRDAALKAESPRPQLVPLNYSSATELAKKLEPMLSPHGKIAVDERTNQLIVTDVSGNREQISRLALSLDTQTPQISIEARIVEARSTFLRQIGIQWGGRALAGANGGNATGLVWPSSIGLIGGNEDAQTNRTGVASPSDFAVNLPAGTGTGEGGALGLSLGSVGGNFNINLRLSALEDAGTVRIISAPKITVLNNKQASIASGVSIPISTISATGTQTQFVQADLRLDVTPTVSQRDCAISMNLVVQKNEPDFVNVGARGDPTILRKEAHTSMLVADGETSVLGGIYTRNSGLAYKKIPFLGDLPVLGWLFKNRRENDDRTEILVFITPKITNRALLSCK
jgi:type IV pilus assembly protein PilQ